MNTPLIVSNIKSYISTLSDFYKLQNDVWKYLEKENYRYHVAVPNSLISIISKEEYVGFSVGSQNYTGLEAGAHTGTDTINNILEAGAKFVILGHSEVRSSGEDSFVVGQKVSSALQKKLKVILCIGEKTRMFDGDKHETSFSVEIISMLSESLGSVNKNDLHNLIIAYEPVWAIGSSTPATPDLVQESIIIIRRELARRFGIDVAKKIKIIYGGSVDEKNANEYIRKSTCDGILVGRASTDAKIFAKLINNVYGNK